MKRINIIISGVVVLTIMIPSLSFVMADDSLETNTKTKSQGKEIRLDNLVGKIEFKQNKVENRASSTENRLENRERNIERIREGLASSTASTSAKRIEKLNDRLDKQREQMGKVQERLLDKELKVVEVLEKIITKIEDRINISENRGLNMVMANTKLVEANAKMSELITEGQSLADLAKTEITDTNKDTLFISIKTSQNKIRTLAKATHALLVDTIKEITKVLPQRNSTTTTTSTN